MSAKLPRSELHTVTVYKLTTGCLLTKKIWQNLKNAVEDDDAAQVRAILDQEPYLVNRLVHDKENHYSFLYLAAQNGSVEIAKALIAANAYVNQQCSGRCGTPLSIASHNGHKKFVQLLLSQQEIVVDMWSDKRYTPLHQAATNGHTSIVRRLLCANASVDHVNDYGDTGLVAAARKGHLAACQQLLKHKAAVNHQNGRGFSSLYLAAKHGNEALVSALLEANAIVDVACRERMAPLRLAVSNGHLAAVQRLIAAGADINHRDSLLYTALHEAARCDSENGAAIVEDLLHAQADPNAALEDGATPLLFAGSYGHTDRIPLLLHARADINSADLEGNTALVGAASKCRVEAAKLLLDQGADRMKKGKYSARQQARGRAGGIEALFNCTLCGWEGMCCSDCRQKYCRFECDKFSGKKTGDSVFFSVVVSRCFC